MAEPITLSEAKAWIRIDDDYTIEDNLISALITAARIQIENETYVLLVPREDIKQNFRRPCCGRIIGETRLLYAPVDIDTVVFKDLQGNTETFENYGTETDPVYWLSYSVDATYNAGYATPDDVPEDLKLAIKIMVATYYRDRENTTTDTVNKVDQTAKKLYQKYSRNVF
jgi:hypothetical protein